MATLLERITLQNVSAWRRAGSHLVEHWGAWLVFLIITFAAGSLTSFAVRPLLPTPPGVMPLGAQAAFAQSMAALTAVATAAPLFTIIGSFMTAAEFSLLKAAADTDAAPTFASYFRGGWDWWSWTWRGIGFGLVLGLAVYLATFIVGFVGAMIPILGVIIIIALVLAWFLVVIPVAVWGWIAGFCFRPTPYWTSLKRTWTAFRAHPGPMLGPVYAIAGVSLVVFGPVLLPVILITSSGAPPVGTPTLTPPFLLAALVVSAFELWALLTIVIRIREWEDGGAEAAPSPEDAAPSL